MIKTLAEKYLNTFINRKNRIYSLREKRNELFSKATGVKSVDLSRERVQVSHTSNFISDMSISLAELDEQIVKEWQQLEEDIFFLMQQLRLVRNVQYNRTLYKIYVEGKSYNQIAEEMNVRSNTVRTYRHKGIQAFEEANIIFLNDWSISRMKHSEQVKLMMNELLEVERQKQRITERETKIKEFLLQEMQQENMEKLEDANLRIDYIGEKNKRTVDVKRLKEGFPDAFRQCVKQKAVSPFIQVQLLSE